MAPSDPDYRTLDYRTLDYRPDLPGRREPKVWVFGVLVMAYLAGIMGGGVTWRFAPPVGGHDPMADFVECVPFSLTAAGVLCVVYFKRTWRLTLAPAAVSVVIGGLTSVAALALHEWRFR